MELLKVDKDRKLYQAKDIKIGNIYCCVDEYVSGTNKIVIVLGVYDDEHVRVVEYGSIDDLPMFVSKSSLYKVNQETQKPIFNDNTYYDIKFTRNELIDLAYGNVHIAENGSAVKNVIKELLDIVNE